MILFDWLSGLMCKNRLLALQRPRAEEEEVCKASIPNTWNQSQSESVVRVPASQSLPVPLSLTPFESIIYIIIQYKTQTHPLNFWVRQSLSLSQSQSHWLTEMQVGHALPAVGPEWAFQSVSESAGNIKKDLKICKLPASICPWSSCLCTILVVQACHGTAHRTQTSPKYSFVCPQQFQSHAILSNIHNCIMWHVCV